MSVRRKALLAATAAAVALGGLAGCGEEAGETAQPEASTVSTPAPTQSADPTRLVPIEVDDGFTGLRKAAAQLTHVADLIAYGTRIEERKSRDGDLRADLAHLLTEHVYLVGMVVDVAFSKSEKSEETELATAALDENSVAVSKLFGRVMEKVDEEAFLTSWRAHAASFVAYAVAVKGDDYTAERKAEAELDEYRVTAAGFLAERTAGKLPAYVVKAELRTHIDSLKNAIDAFAADGERGFEELKLAADHMPKAAAALAEGLNKAVAATAGTSDVVADPAAGEVRAQLRALMTGNVYLTGMAAFTALTHAKTVTSTPYLSAKAVLDDSSKELAQAIGDVSTSARQVAFLEDWRTHLNDLEDYVAGAARGSRSAKETALARLEEYRDTGSRFFSRLTRNRTPAEDFSDAFDRHLGSLTGTIDALKAALGRVRS